MGGVMNLWLIGCRVVVVGLVCVVLSCDCCCCIFVRCVYVYFELGLFVYVCVGYCFYGYFDVFDFEGKIELSGFVLCCVFGCWRLLECVVRLVL